MKALIVILMLGVFSHLWAKPLAVFKGKEGIYCEIIHKDNTKTLCNKNKKFYLEAGDIVKTDGKLFLRVLSNDVYIDEEKLKDTIVYSIAFKEDEGILNTLKKTTAFMKNYEKRTKAAATRSITDAQKYPQISFITPEEAITFKVEKSKVVESPVYLEIYDVANGSILIEKIVLNEGKDNFYYQFRPLDFNLKKSGFYLWKLKDNIVSFGEGVFLVSNLDESELEDIVNTLIPKVKYNLNDELKKALIYAKLGYLWKAKQILTKYKKEQLDRAYLKEIEKYFEAEKE